MTEVQDRIMKRAIKVLAIREAIKAVKQQLVSQGLTVEHIPHEIIVAAADEYLNKHRSELVAEAAKMVERRRSSGRIPERRRGVRNRVQ